MNRKTLKRLMVTLMTLVVLYGCSSDEDSPTLVKTIEPLTTQSAQNYYNSVYGTAPKLKSSDDETSLLPDWDLAQLYTDSLWYAVESPFSFDDGVKITLMTSDVSSRIGSGKTDEVKQVLRLVILRNKETGKTVSFIIAVLPDYDYMKRKGDAVYENKYLTRDSDLDGVILFFGIDGQLVNGWIYEDGKITGYTISGNSNLMSTKKQSTYCWEQVTEVNGEEIGRTIYCEETGGGGDLPYSDRGSSTLGGLNGGISGDYSDPSGGDRNTDDRSQSTAKAKKIFRNSKMTEANWQKLEQMLDKIMQDCMGVAMYDGLANNLNGKTLTIQFVNDENSYFNYGDGSIYLSDRMESNRLYHEMFHAYQSYQETQSSYAASAINLEIEAFYAQYLYLSKLPEYSGSKWEKWYDNDPLFKSIKNLEQYVSNKGNLMSGTTSSSFDIYILNGPVAQFQQNNSYKYLKYDYNRNGLDIFKNIRTLTKNCI